MQVSFSTYRYITVEELSLLHSSSIRECQGRTLTCCCGRSKSTSGIIGGRFHFHAALTLIVLTNENHRSDFLLHLFQFYIGDGKQSLGTCHIDIISTFLIGSKSHGIRHQYLLAFLALCLHSVCLERIAQGLFLTHTQRKCRLVIIVPISTIHRQLISGVGFESSHSISILIRFILQVSIPSEQEEIAIIDRSILIRKF